MFEVVLDAHTVESKEVSQGTNNRKVENITSELLPIKANNKAHRKESKTVAAFTDQGLRVMEVARQVWRR